VKLCFPRQAVSKPVLEIDRFIEQLVMLRARAKVGEHVEAIEIEFPVSKLTNEEIQTL
jgi:hypothetical protein